MAKKKNKASQLAGTIIVVLLIIGLAGFGVTNFGGNIDSIGRVGEREISIQRYANALRGQMQAFGIQSAEQARQIGLDQRALQSLVAAAALENEAAQLGVSAGDETVRREVLQMPAFRNLEGKFDRATYADRLERSGLNERQFEDDLRAEIAASMLQGAVAGGVDTPPEYVDVLMDFIGERRSFSWVALTEDDLSAPIPEPSEQDLRKYYEEHPDEFMLPETRRITYDWLTPEMLAPSIEVSEQDVRALYQQRIDEFVKPEQRLVERLVFPDEASAAEAKARLDAGEISFEDLVAERQLELADIDLGPVTADDLGDAAKAVFATEEPGVVGPVDTDLGPALFRVNAIIAASETPFEEARAGLESELRLEEARRKIAELIDHVDDLLASGAMLEELAAETELELGKIDWFDGASGGIADIPEFREAAAKAREGDFPEVVVARDGSIFALRLDEILPPRLQDFEAARDKAAQGWRRQALLGALSLRAEALADQIRNGSAEGVELKKVEKVTRDATVPDAAPDLVETVFKMEPGEVRVIPAENSVLVVRLDEILPPDPENPELAQQREVLARSIRRSLSDDILTAYANALMTQAGIQIDQAALNAVNTQLR